MNKLLFSILGVALVFVTAVIIVNQYNTKNFAQSSFLEIEKKYSYKIERDQFGVPHIYGDTDKDAAFGFAYAQAEDDFCLLYTSPSPRDRTRSRMPSSA